MSDKQLLYYIFYKSDKKCDEVAVQLKEKHYQTVEDYVRCKKEIKADIMQMLCKEEQVTFETSEKSLHKRNKTPEEKALAAKRKQIQDRVKHLYNQIGKRAYGNDEYCRVADISNGSSSKNGANSPSPSTASTSSLSTNSTPPSNLKEYASPLTTSSAPTPSPTNFNKWNDNDEEFELSNDESVSLLSAGGGSLLINDSSIPSFRSTSLSAGGGRSEFKVDKAVAIDKKKNQYYGQTHYLENPFFLLVVGSAGSGKTTFIGHLVNAMNPIGGMKTYDRIWYVIPEGCPKCEVILTLELNYGVQVFEGLDSMPELPTDNTDGTLLIIFDDMLGVKDKGKRIESCFKMGRRVCSLIFIAQSYFKIEKFYRDNMYYLAMLPPMLQGDTKSIMDNIGGGLETEVLRDIFNIGTSERYVPLVIDVKADVYSRFRKGLTGDLIPVPPPTTAQPRRNMGSIMTNKKLNPNDIVYTPDGPVIIILEDCVKLLGDNLEGTILDPCRGDGAFFKQFPTFFPMNKYDYCEIDEGRDFFTYTSSEPTGAVISNPPYSLIDKFLIKASELKPKLISFLLLFFHINPKRLQLINDLGYAIKGCRTFLIADWFTPVNLILVKIEDRPVEMSDNCIQFSTERFKKVKVSNSLVTEDELVLEFSGMNMQGIPSPPCKDTDDYESEEESIESENDFPSPLAEDEEDDEEDGEEDGEKDLECCYCGGSIIHDRDAYFTSWDSEIYCGECEEYCETVHPGFWNEETGEIDFFEEEEEDEDDD